MNRKIRFHSSFGRMGAALGTAWRFFLFKLTRSEPQIRNSHHKVWMEASVKLLCLLGLVAVVVALTLLIVTDFFVVLARKWWGLAEPLETREDSVPDYLGADLYISDYDNNGHYIGDCKSSD